VIPNLIFGQLSKDNLKAINQWVEEGGTLIAIDKGISGLVKPDAKISNVRVLADTFKDIEEYDIALQREWLSQQSSYSVIDDIWSHDAANKVTYPWVNGAKTMKEKDLEKQEQWLAKFAPSGAMVASRTDQKHWLTFGTPKTLPILVSNNPILMSNGKSQAVVRMGVYTKMNKTNWKKIVTSFKDKPVSRKIGWSSLPDEQQLTLRMSGLLWPEASQRLANSAYLTRESKGKGQIILFASQPVFRGSTMGTNRLLLNALVYATGLGTQNKINL
jgi:hypothetical protein